MSYIPGDEHSVDIDERLGNYDEAGNWVGPDPTELADDYLAALELHEEER